MVCSPCFFSGGARANSSRVAVDIFVNCIYLTAKIPSFVDPASIAAIGDKRNLRCVVDVSCDTTNPNNPIPIYSINTTFDKPTVDVPGCVLLSHLLPAR